MAKLSSFLFVSLNGFFEAPGRDISWHVHDAESDAYSQEGLESGNMLVFGRVTYELMASWWPSAAAADAYPLVAQGMNTAEKLVFSRTLKKADWKNTRLIKGDLEAEMRRLKQSSARDMTILGSGSIVRQLAQSGLIDEYEFLVDPVALGDGTSIFKGLRQALNLKFASARPLKNGSVLLRYQAA